MKQRSCVGVVVESEACLDAFESAKWRVKPLVLEAKVVRESFVLLRLVVHDVTYIHIYAWRSHMAQHCTPLDQKKTTFAWHTCVLSGCTTTHLLLHTHT
jgi:hypothetical protein